MKLMLIIINYDDVQDVTKALLKEKYYVTKLSSTGGLLHSGNTTLLVGVDDNKVDEVKEIVGNYAKTRKKKITKGEPGDLNYFSYLPGSIKISGATIFVLSVDEYHKL